MPTTQIEQVRSFNRLVTERVGALNEQFLGRGRPLGESRLLWEIGNDGVEIRQLRGRLALDSAYVSRLLRSLERQGLVTVEDGVGDGRVRHVHLTEAGRSERATLDLLSDDSARSILAPLSDTQRSRLTAAMAEVERLLLASMITVDIANPASPAARWCFEQYFAELARCFDTGFDPALSISADTHELAPPRGALFISWLRHEPIGCTALKLHEDSPAELKRMWVSPAARGLGLGRRLLAEAERYALDAGVTVIHLETNRSLTEAIALYRQSGYREVPPFNAEPYAHYWFEKRLDTATEQR